MEAIREFLSETRELVVSIKAHGLRYDILEQKEIGLIERENGDLCLIINESEFIEIKPKKIKNVIYTTDATGYEQLTIKLGKSVKVILATEISKADL